MSLRQDIVVFLQGSRVPLLIRQVSAQTFQFLGSTLFYATDWPDVLQNLSASSRYSLSVTDPEIFYPVWPNQPLFKISYTVRLAISVGRKLLKASFLARSVVDYTYLKTTLVRGVQVTLREDQGIDKRHI